MRISWRPSGSEKTPGRGEYEISEQFGQLIPSDLLGRAIVLDLGGGLAIQSGISPVHQGGKIRLRRIDRGSGIQLHRQYAAAMLMPNPVRDANVWGRGQPVMFAGRYTISHINLASARLVNGDRAILAVGETELRNASYEAEFLRHQARLASVQRAWKDRLGFPDEIRDLLAEHERIVRSQAAIPQRAERIVAEIQRVLSDISRDLDIPGNSSETDALPSLMQLLQESAVIEEPVVDIEAIPQDEIEIRRRELKQRRQAAAYRPNAPRFRKAVRNAYGFRCVVCGLYLPAIGGGSKPGVDAAHILPYSEFDMDHVTNALCLCKLHHWAFDEGLIEIAWDDSRYGVAVPEAAAARSAQLDRNFSLDFLKQVEGRIPVSRLPSDRSLWPSARCLDKLRELFS